MSRLQIGFILMSMLCICLTLVISTLVDKVDKLETQNQSISKDGAGTYLC